MDERAVALLRDADQIMILTHRRPDGDTVGCAAALCLGLRQLGKTAWVFPNEDITPLFSPYLEGLIDPMDASPGFIVAVDTASKGILTNRARRFGDNIDLVIDHHGTNEQYGWYNCVDPSCAACGELVYRILLKLGVHLTPEIALPLYVAVSTDTGCFAYSNTTAGTHRVAAALMEAGTDFAAVNKRHFRTKSLRRLRLEGLMTEHMHFYHDGVVSIIPISLAMMQGIGAGEEDAEDIAAFAGQVEGVRVSATIRQIQEGECKISLRTWPELCNAAAACALLGGGGHPAAAGCTVRGTLAEAEAAILSAIRCTMTPVVHGKR